MTRTVRCLAAALLAFAVSATASAAEGVTGFYRFPALQGSHVVFVAEGDLWRASASGGRAERLTTHPGAELRPALSHDGRWLAFNASYEGPLEAYAMAQPGGVPRRLTWDGRASRVWGFTPAGEVLLSTGTESGRPGTQLVAIDPATLARRVLPVADASDGAVSADGRTLYFTRAGLDSDNVRQYRGGATARLWAIDLAGDREARVLVQTDANARRPMPYGSAGAARVAFLSDRSGTFNVWSVDAQGRDLRQHTRHGAFDVRHASIDGSRVVYAVGADLHIVDLASNADRRLEITLGGDFDQLRTRWVAAPPFFTGARLSPDGDRVLIGSRGRIATQGTGAWRRAELPVADGTRCNGAVFGHDGKQVYAICDGSGETEIWRFAADGTGEPQRITRDGGVQRHRLFPSPDGRWIAHTDHAGRLAITALDGGGETRLVHQATAVSWWRQAWWSADGQALVYVDIDPQHRRDRLYLYTLADRRTIALNSDRYEAAAPAFTPDGRWLYFLSDRNFVSARGSPWGDRNLGPYFDRRTRIYALALQPGNRFPFKARDELMPPSARAPAVPAASASASTPSAAASAPARAAPAARPALVVEGLAARLHEVPLPAGDYSALRTDGKRLYFLEGDNAPYTLKSIAIDDNGAPPETFTTEVQTYEITPDGKKMMVVKSAPRRTVRPGTAPRAGDIWLLDTAAKPPAEIAKAQVRWSEWQIAVDPRAEWRQTFADAWRQHRDRFYDRAMHGADWQAARRQYEALLPRVTDRDELDELMAQMATHVGALHSTVRTLDIRRGSDDIAAAGLGAHFTKVADGWRVDRVFRGDPELPAEASPLAEAEIAAGAVITHINGRATRDAPSLGELLRGQAGRQVLIGFNDAGGNARQAIATPVTTARHELLRVTDWEWGLAERTLSRSGGRIGYLRLRAMTSADIATFAREFYSHVHREGIVIDVRANGGGNIDSWLIEKLLRRVWAYWQPRSPEGGAPYSNMQQTFRGHLALLVDHRTYSDGETFAEGVKRLKLGTLIGQRTAGAGIWLSDSNTLVDFGLMRSAESGQFTLDGQWLIERGGVVPDIEVDNPPRATAAGGDAQLDAAIAHLMSRIAAQPVPQPRAPAYPRPFNR